MKKAAFLAALMACATAAMAGPQDDPIVGCGGAMYRRSHCLEVAPPQQAGASNGVTCAKKPAFHASYDKEWTDIVLCVDDSGAVLGASYRNDAQPQWDWIDQARLMKNNLVLFDDGTMGGVDASGKLEVSSITNFSLVGEAFEAELTFNRLHSFDKTRAKMAAMAKQLKP